MQLAAALLVCPRGGRGNLASARLDAVIAGIDEWLADSELSAATLGIRLGLSERYVHHLLAEAGLKFTRLVREKRLERARRMLERPGAAGMRIVDIAYATGFGDLSNFNRVFRRRFGRTPSDMRRKE